MTRTAKEVGDEARARSGRELSAGRPEPTDDELLRAVEDAKRVDARREPVTSVWRDDYLSGVHNDDMAHLVRIEDAFGTRSRGWLSANLGALEHATRARGTERGADPKATQFNAAVAFMTAVRPENELEAAIAMQMATTHSLTMEMFGKARHAEETVGLETYVGLATKLQRTFSDQLDALSKLRGGGKQVVEHRYVYVQGNAVVGDVHQGGAAAGGQLPHTPAALASPAPSDGLPLWGPHPKGKPMPVASCDGAQAVPDARRSRRKRGA